MYILTKLFMKKAKSPSIKLHRISSLVLYFSMLTLYHAPIQSLWEQEPYWTFRTRSILLNMRNLRASLYTLMTKSCAKDSRWLWVRERESRKEELNCFTTGVTSFSSFDEWFLYFFPPVFPLILNSFTFLSSSLPYAPLRIFISLSFFLSLFSPKA